jgi:hypothetical protein
MTLPVLGEVEHVLGLMFLIAAGLILIGFYVLTRQGLKPDLRPLSGYEAMLDQVGQAVESGGRVHVSLGTNSMIGEDTGVTLAGLAILDVISDASAISDRAPVATTTDPTTLPVMSDTIRRGYRQMGTLHRYESTAARLVALDSMALAAGATSIIADDQVQANVLAGSLGMEAALMAEAGQRKRIPQVFASDRLQAQATGLTMADHTLIGEEMFVARAYLEQDPSTTASVLTQDILRWIVIGAIGVGSLLATVGINLF